MKGTSAGKGRGEKETGWGFLAASFEVTSVTPDIFGGAWPGSVPLKILLRLKALITAMFTPVSNSVRMSTSRALSGTLRMRLCRIGLKQWALKRNILLVVLLSLTTSNETPWQFWENEFALKTHSSYKQCINYFINLLFLHYGKHSSIYIFPVRTQTRYR